MSTTALRIVEGSSMDKSKALAAATAAGFVVLVIGIGLLVLL